VHRQSNPTTIIRYKIIYKTINFMNNIEDFTTGTKKVEQHFKLR